VTWGIGEMDLGGDDVGRSPDVESAARESTRRRTLSLWASTEASCWAGLGSAVMTVDCGGAAGRARMREMVGSMPQR
jgi:hypothetical protein